MRSMFSDDHSVQGLNHSSVVTKHVLFLLCINVVIRGLWLLYMHPPQALDFEWYYTHAVQMAQGQGYRQDTQYTAYWPIGYPYFLSLLFRITGPSVALGLVTNALISIGIVVLVYFLARRLTRPRIALFAALGYTILPSQIEWNSVLGSEELATGLLLLSLFLYVCSSKMNHRWWLVILSGITLGASCDVRPIPMLFPVAIWLYEWCIEHSRLRTCTVHLLLVFGGLALGVCPVTIRNFVALHHFVLVSTNGGVDLWQGTHTDSAYFWSWSPQVNPLLAAGKNQILEGSIGTHVFLQHVIHHPFWTVIHGFLKWFFLYWVDWNVVSVTFQMFAKHPANWLISSAMWFDTIVYWLWMVVCIVGFWKGIRLAVSSWKVLGLPFLYLTYNTAVFFFFPAWDRFRYPLMPLFAIFFGLGVYAMFQIRLEKREQSRRTVLDNFLDSEKLS